MNEETTGRDPMETQQTPDKRRRILRRRLLLLAAAAVAAAGMLSALALYKSWVRPPVLPSAPVPPAVIGAPGVGAPPAEPGEYDGEEPVAAAGRKQGFYTFLICGVDDGNGGGDTLIVAAFDTVGMKANLVSIPRDTLINVSWSAKRINSAYNAGGIERLKQEVSKLIGFSVDFYIEANYEGFISLVEALKGVPFDVPYHMNYDDPTQDLHIHVSKGFQVLDGQSAAGVVRWRKNNDGTGYANGDIGRIETQQAFLNALAKQLFKPSNLTRVPEFAAIFDEYVEADLTLGEFIWLGRRAMSVKAEDIFFTTIPGNYNEAHYSAYYKTWLSYVTLDIDAVVELVNERLNPYNREIDASMLDIMTIQSDGSMASSTGVLQDPSAGIPPVIPQKEPVPDAPSPGETEETPGDEDPPPEEVPPEEAPFPTEALPGGQETEQTDGEPSGAPEGETGLADVMGGFFRLMRDSSETFEQGGMT